MDSENLNRWLTLGANLGVLIGIILILIELNQNAALMRAQMSQARSDQLRASYEARVHSDYWPAIIAKVEDASSTQEWIESLSSEEYERVRVFYLGLLNDLINQSYLCNEGYLDEELCRTNTRNQLRRAMPILPYVYNPGASGLLTTMIREISIEEGNLPYPNDDGSWSLPEDLALPGIFRRPRDPDFRERAKIPTE